MQIFDNPEPIVADDRYFIYNRICQIKLSGHLGKKYKHIHLYIFNDGLLWCSKRGQWKKGFKFINTNLLYGIPENSNSADATMFIQYGSRHKNKKKKKKKKTTKSKSKNKSPTTHPQCILNESKENLEMQQSEDEEEFAMQVNHGKPTKKTVLVFVNEQARDQCLEKIKQTQTKYLKRLQRQQQKRRERQKLKAAAMTAAALKSKSSGSNNNLSGANNEQSLTLSHTEESSIYAQISIENSSGNAGNKYDSILSLKPLESHKQYSNTFSTTLNSSGISSAANLLDGANEQSDDTDNEHENERESGSDHRVMEIDNSKSSKSHSNNSSLGNINCKALKQSVSTEITTIKEEDEEDVKAEHD